MKKKPHELTELQLDILGVIWDRGSATVHDVQSALSRRYDYARKTIATMLVRLEQQGILEHEVDGREFIYRALITRSQVRRASLKNIVDRLFEGSAPALVSFALENSQVTSAELKEAKRLLEKHRPKRGRKND